MLHIDPIGLSRLPACLGNLTELQWVDLRGNWLSDSSEGWAMPTSLSSWKKLKMFIAFGQSYQGCPGSEADCVLSWHAKRDLEWEEDDESRPWRCRSTGWRPKFDDPLQPWWGWASIETFWVDQNFFHGHIPEDMASRWQSLRTLDLYDNEIGGTLPASVSTLEQVHQIQLAGNQLDGTLPLEVLGMKSLRKINADLNPKLHGCIETEQLSRLEHTLDETRIRVADSCAESDGHSLLVQDAQEQMNFQELAESLESFWDGYEAIMRKCPGADMLEHPHIFPRRQHPGHPLLQGNPSTEPAWLDSLKARAETLSLTQLSPELRKRFLDPETPPHIEKILWDGVLDTLDWMLDRYLQQEMLRSSRRPDGGEALADEKRMFAAYRLLVEEGLETSRWFGNAEAIRAHPVSPFLNTWHNTSAEDGLSELELNKLDAKAIHQLVATRSPNSPCLSAGTACDVVDGELRVVGFRCAAGQKCLPSLRTTLQATSGTLAHLHTLLVTYSQDSSDMKLGAEEASPEVLCEALQAIPNLQRLIIHTPREEVDHDEPSSREPDKTELPMRFHIPLPEECTLPGLVAFFWITDRGL